MEGCFLKAINVGVIGVGNMGRHHVRLYSEMKDVNLFGIVDIDEEKGKLMAKEFNTHFFDNYEDLIGNVDAVSIAVPTFLHYSIGMKFLENNTHILIEKPITIDLDQSMELVATAKNQNLVLQVGHLERFNPAVVQLKKLVKQPIFIEAHRLSVPTKRNLDVGVVWDLMIHDLDILIYLVNSPLVESRSLGYSDYSLHEDLAWVQLIFESGCMVNLVASRISGEKLRQLKVVEPNKTFRLDFMNQTLSITKSSPKNKVSVEQWVPVEKGEPLRLELEHFLECIRKNKQPLVTGEDGKKALELALASVKNMRMVKNKDEFLAITG